MITTPLLPLLLVLGLTSDPTAPVDLGEPVPASFALGSPMQRHGHVEWFDGTFDELLAKAAREKRVVLLNFYTDLCAYCRVLDREAYSDSSVVEALKPVLCFSINADSEAGRALDASYPTEDHYPALIFLDSDGALRDRIIGYLPTRQFLPEVERILRNEDTLSDLREKVAKSPADVEAIWALACKLEQLGDLEACDKEIEHIKKLDPQGKSRPMHHLALSAAIKKSIRTDDDEALRKLLAIEIYPELLFEGWNQLAFQDLMRAKAASMQGLGELARRHKLAYHQSHLNAWPNCPSNLRADYGNHVAWELYLDWSRVDEDLRQAAINVAREAVGAAPKAPEILDTLACLLFNDGQIDEAVRLMQKCIRLEPDRDLWEDRLEMFLAKES
jgi:thioredoxin-related protein